MIIVEIYDNFLPPGGNLALQQTAEIGSSRTAIHRHRNDRHHHHRRSYHPPQPQWKRNRLAGENDRFF